MGPVWTLHPQSNQRTLHRHQFVYLHHPVTPTHISTMLHTLPHLYS